MDTITIDTNWSWAVGIGFLVVAWVLYAVIFKGPDGKRDFLMTKMWEGKDGRASFSKFQFWLWTWVILLGLVSIWVARIIASEGLVKPINDIPENLLILLGLSVTTSLAAKTITTEYTSKSLNKKPGKKKAGPKTTAPAPVTLGSDRAGPVAPGPIGAASNVGLGPTNPAPTSLSATATTPADPEFSPIRELVADDGGVPELAKIQMFLFTLVAVTFFLISVGSAINSGEEKELVLPDVDQALLLLMGVSASGYLGKKLVTREHPVLTGIMPSRVRVGTVTTIMLTGRALGDIHHGAVAIGTHMYKTSAQKTNANIEWTDSVVSVDFDGQLPLGEHLVEVIVGDTKSDPQVLTVV